MAQPIAQNAVTPFIINVTKPENVSSTDNKPSSKAQAAIKDSNCSPSRTSQFLTVPAHNPFLPAHRVRSSSSSTTQRTVDKTLQNSAATAPTGRTLDRTEEKYFNPTDQIPNGPAQNDQLEPQFFDEEVTLQFEPYTRRSTTVQSSAAGASNRNSNYGTFKDDKDLQSQPKTEMAPLPKDEPEPKPLTLGEIQPLKADIVETRVVQRLFNALKSLTVMGGFIYLIIFLGAAAISGAAWPIVGVIVASFVIVCCLACLFDNIRAAMSPYHSKKELEANIGNKLLISEDSLETTERIQAAKNRARENMNFLAQTLKSEKSDSLPYEKKNIYDPNGWGLSSGEKNSLLYGNSSFINKTVGDTEYLVCFDPDYTTEQIMIRYYTKSDIVSLPDDTPISPGIAVDISLKSFRISKEEIAYPSEHSNAVYWRENSDK